MAGFSDLFETLMSCSVEVAGQGAIHGGKGIMLAGARKIGWAGQGGCSRQGRRFSGHSLAGKSLASGCGGLTRGSVGNYDPKRHYQSSVMDRYHQSMKCGSGVMRFSGPNKGRPAKLHGRPCFDAPDSALGRYGSKWVKNAHQRPVDNVMTPRSNIKYK